MEPSKEDLAQELHEAYVQHKAGRLAEAAERWKADPAEPHVLTFSGPLEARPHRFCPSPTVPGADCPNCKKPLLHLLSLKADRLPFWTLPSPAAIHLLYCWICAIPFDLFSYRIRQDGSVEILQYLDRSSDSIGPDGPYDGYTGIFPESRVGLRALSEEEQRIARQLSVGGEGPEEYRYLTEPIHQIGGFPLICNAYEVQCPACDQAAPFFATIRDNAAGHDYQSDPLLTFTGNSGIQMVFHWCASCAVMTAYHSCD